MQAITPPRANTSRNEHAATDLVEKQLIAEQIQRQIPFFSIIVPVYNAGKYLRQCIDSILEQDFTDYELWLIDDGSTDDSGKICDEYKDDCRIHIIHKENSGVSSSRNIGLEKANGQYILFIDSDDYLKPRALNVFKSELDKFPDAEYVKGNYYLLIDGKNELQSIWKEERSHYSGMLLSGEDMLTKILKTEFFSHNSIYKRQFIEEHKLRFYEELTMLEDLVFIMQVCAYAKNCIFIPTETLTYRFSEGSLLRGKKNFAKINSLAKGSYYVRSLIPLYSNAGKHFLTKRYVEMAITSINQAAKYLTEEERSLILSQLKRYNKKLPLATRSFKHLFCALIYNINPRLAMSLLTLFYK